MANYHPAPTASVSLILRTSNIPLPYGATISNVPLSAEKMDNNFISNQNIFLLVQRIVPYFCRNIITRCYCPILKL